jgi:threonine dehydrogenase-like Zn-dependent dehydrogenase
MPLELILEGPKKIGYREYTDNSPVGDEVLIQTTISGIKSGTEINLYRGCTPFATEFWDPELRLFRQPMEGERLEPFFPHRLGSWAVGKVVSVGPEVKRFREGDLVHGEWQHRQTSLMREIKLHSVKSLALCETMLFADPARFALAAVHDAAIKLGDSVAVFGMGAIGMLAIQMARLSGSQQVIAVDPIIGRLQLARNLGADVIVNPAEGDVGLAIKHATDGKGVDVAIEISGDYSALQEALRCVRQGGLVVAASYYGAQDNRLDLSKEWHHNRITLRSSMPVWDCPHREYPLWDLARIERVVIEMLESGSVEVKPIIGARIPFERAAEAYSMIDESPDEKVKIILTYGAQES